MTINPVAKGNGKGIHPQVVAEFARYRPGGNNSRLMLTFHKFGIVSICASKEVIPLLKDKSKMEVFCAQAKDIEKGPALQMLLDRTFCVETRLKVNSILADKGVLYFLAGKDLRFAPQIKGQRVNEKNSYDNIKPSPTAMKRFLEHNEGACPWSRVFSLMMYWVRHPEFRDEYPNVPEEYEYRRKIEEKKMKAKQIPHAKLATAAAIIKGEEKRSNDKIEVEGTSFHKVAIDHTQGIMRELQLFQQEVHDLTIINKFKRFGFEKIFIDAEAEELLANRDLQALLKECNRIEDDYADDNNEKHGASRAIRFGEALFAYLCKGSNMRVVLMDEGPNIYFLASEQNLSVYAKLRKPLMVEPPPPIITKLKLDALKGND
jgi:hypothetical protein